MSAIRDARERLRRTGTLPDDRIDLAETALDLAVLDRPNVDPAWYRQHLEALALGVTEHMAGLGRGPGGVEPPARALAAVIAGQYGYRGDDESYDDLQNANLMRVIDRRRGLPVTLGILYLHVARAQGWHAAGLSFPGQFLIRLDIEGERAILDPFGDGQMRGPGDLREMLKIIAGPAAELTREHYAPVTDRQILLRLQGNMKSRLLRSEQFERALAVLDSMLLIAPNEPLLWREAGLLHARLDQPGAAIRALERFVAFETGDALQHEATVLLQRLRIRIN